MGRWRDLKTHVDKYPEAVLGPREVSFSDRGSTFSFYETRTLGKTRILS